MLIENTLFGMQDKVQIAIDRLKAFEPDDGYWVAYSGGKDSEVVLDLVKRSGVKYDAHFNVTSVEAPETIYFIRREHPEVIWEFPKDKDGKVKTMWNLIPKKLYPPTRLVRYCCAELKESSGKGRITVTGVRWAESVNRKKNRHLVDMGGKGNIVYNDDNDDARRMVEQCYRTKKTLVNPVIDWTDEDVWEYMHKYDLPINPLYRQGSRRVGCVGCPMNTNSKKELEDFPQIKRLYLRAFEKMLDEMDKKGLEHSWRDAEDVMTWWVNGGKYPSKIQTRIEVEDL